MSPHDMWKFIKSDYLKLIPILALAFYIAFIPHANYPYPVHIDEWFHLAYASAMQEAGSVVFTEPFTGDAMLGLSSNLEAGFHLFLTVFQQISAISWMTVFRYFPSVIFVITIVSVYALAKREGFGWEAALFTSLIPTTVGILGPAFLVPVAMGLLFIPLSLFIAFNFRNFWAYIVLFIFTSFLLSIHAPSAIMLPVILTPHVLLNIKSNFRHSLGITLAVLIPFLAPFPWIFALLLPTATKLLIPQSLPTYVAFPQIIKTYGYLPVILCLFGTFLLAWRGGKKNYSFVLGLLTLLLMLVTFYTFQYGVSIVYERGLMYMMLMVGITAGAGLAGIKKFSLPERLNVGLPRVTQNLGRLGCLVLIGITLALAIPARQNTPYYHVIDAQEYEDFVWIKENVGKEYHKAIVDPWKATAFTAITGKHVYTRIHAFPTASDEEARKFLNEGCRNTDFLKENSISIVYTRGNVTNPDLAEIRKHVYLLKQVPTP